MIIAPKKKCLASGLILSICLGLNGCGLKDKTAGNTSSLNSLQKLSFSNVKTRMGAIRVQALRDTALSVGARGGLAWRAAQMNTVLLQHENMLYRLFNFNAMLLDKNVLPPVLTEGRKTLSLGGTDTIRIADRTFLILNQAKFVTASPTWRNYLWLSYSPPEAPDRTLLPRNREERLVWKKYIEEGWRAGIQQAELIFKENIARLKRDYQGMILYRTLLAQNIVSPPYVAELDMGITGGGSDLTVNDRVLRITAFPMLQNNSQEWKTEIIPHE
jgi:defect-in-organelle-trafficking protein DotC